MMTSYKEPLSWYFCSTWGNSHPLVFIDHHTNKSTCICCSYFLEAVSKSRMCAYCKSTGKEKISGLTNGSIKNQNTWNTIEEMFLNLLEIYLCHEILIPFRWGECSWHWHTIDSQSFEEQRAHNSLAQYLYSLLCPELPPVEADVWISPFWPQCVTPACTQDM